MADSHAHPGVRKSRSTLMAQLRISTPVQDWQSRVLDISLSGMRLARPSQFPLAPSQRVEIELRPEGTAPLHLWGRLVRLGEGDVAVRFDPVHQPLESDLRELIARYGHLHDEFG